MVEKALPSLVVERLLVQVEHGRLRVAHLDHDVPEFRGSERGQPLRVPGRVRLRRIPRVAAGDGFAREPGRLFRAKRALLVSRLDEIQPPDGGPVVVALEVRPGTGDRRTE